MGGIVDVSPLHGIEVDVIELLTQHRLVLDELRMAALLPELIGGVGFVRFFERGQLFQQPIGVVFFEITEDRFGGECLEIVDLSAEIIGLEDAVDMVFEDHVAVNQHAFVFLPPAQGVQDDLHRAGAGEHRQPVEHGPGEEVGSTVFGDGIAAAGHGNSSGVDRDAAGV